MKKVLIKAALWCAALAGVFLCVSFVDCQITYTVQPDNSNLAESALQFLNRGGAVPAQEEVRLCDGLDLGKERYVLMEYIQSGEPQLGRIRLQKGLNGRYKIVSIGYGGGNFRESVVEAGKEKYYIFGGRNTFFGIEEIKAVLEGREYTLPVPEGDYFLVSTAIEPFIQGGHCELDKLRFYNGSGADITDQVPWN